jgi:hypothetical protein
MPQNQECRGCGRVLPVSVEHFGPHPTMALGVRNRCRSCVRDEARKSYAEHAEERRQKAAERRAERAATFRASGLWKAA